MSAITFFVWSPFTDRDYSRFGIEELQKKFQVYVFDCTEWMAPPSLLERKIKTNNFSGYNSIASKQEFNSKLPIILSGKSLVVDILPGNNNSGAFYARQQLSHHGCTMIKLFLGGLPMSHNVSSLLFKLRRIAKKPSKLISWVLNKYRGNNISSHDIAIVGGRIAAEQQKDIVQTVISAHSLDYEIYLSSIDNSKVSTPVCKHIVYLDEDLVYHKDFDHLGIPYITTSEVFYPALTRTFTEFENYFGLPVVVAAHPRSNYKNTNFFGGRDVVKGNTQNLVMDSLLVMAHASTSLSFAVLHEKPIVILSSNDIENHDYLCHTLYGFVEQLGVKPINIDLPTIGGAINQSVLNVDKLKYSRYKSNYLKAPGSLDVPIWSHVSSELLKYNQSRGK